MTILNIFGCSFVLSCKLFQPWAQYGIRRYFGFFSCELRIPSYHLLTVKCCHCEIMFAWLFILDTIQTITFVAFRFTWKWYVFHDIRSVIKIYDSWGENVSKLRSYVIGFFTVERLNLIGLLSTYSQKQEWKGETNGKISWDLTSKFEKIRKISVVTFHLFAPATLDFEVSWFLAAPLPTSLIRYKYV